MRVKSKNKNVYWIILGTLICAIVIMCVLLASKLNILHNDNSTNMQSGTTVNGINISGLSRAEAVEAVSGYISDKADGFSLTLRHNDKIYILDKGDYTINKDVQTIVDMAKGESKYSDELSALKYFTNNGNSTLVAFNYIFQGLDEKIDEICSSIETPAVDSQIQFSPDSDQMFHITPSQSGTKIDSQKLYDKINEQLTHTNQILVDLELEEAEPEITETDNQELTNLVASYTTNVSDSTGGRKNNVKLALSKFNGMVIQPYQSISFNEITAPHTTANGYEVATIILNGRFVDGVGGGICQASTTLYNALVLANVSIDEVHKHTLPVYYVPLALDAMVTEGGSDLKFTNTSPYPLFIKTSSTSDDVTVEIYTKPLANGVTYKTRSETVRTIPALPDRIIPDSRKEYTDHVIFKGETYRLTYPREGYEVISYLEKWQNGNLVDTSVLRHETYQPQPGIIMEGILEPLDGMDIIQSDDTLDMDN